MDRRLDTENKPLLKRLDGPPGSGKTRFLAQEAYRLSRQAGEDVLNAAPEGSSSAIVILCANRLNQARLRHELRLARPAGGEEPGLRKIQVRQIDQWFFAALNQVLALSGKNVELLETQEAVVLLGRLMDELVPREHPLGYAARQPETARFLWQELQGAGPSGFFETLESSLHTPQAAIFETVLQAFEERTAAAGLLRRNQLAQAWLQALLGSCEETQRVRDSVHTLLIDEVQELSAAQHAAFAFLGRPLILAGNSKLSIKPDSQACPERFISLEDYTHFSVELLTPQPPQTATIQELWRFTQAALLEPDLAGFEKDAVPLPEAFTLQAWRAEDRLAEMVALAEDLKRFVASGQVDNRPARYGDCAVLLRSAQSLPLVMEVFKTQGIPYRAFQDIQNPVPELTEAIIDFYRVLAGWKADRLQAPFPASQPGQNDSQTLFWEKRLQAALDEEHALPAWRDAYLRWQELCPLSRLQAASATLEQRGDWFALWPEIANLLLFSKNDPVASDALSQFHQATDRLRRYYRKVFQQPLSLTEWLAHAPVLNERFYLAPAVEPEEDESDETPAVRILKVSQAQGEAFAWVAVPGLVTGEFPCLHKSVGSPFSQNPDESETRLLALAMTRARHALRLSTHFSSLSRDHVEESVQPAPCFEQFRRRTNGRFLLQNWAASESTAGPSGEATQRFSLWGQLSLQAEDAPVISQEDALVLSPSAIKTYMACPRQFYYAKLLKLPQESSPAATFGQIAHRLMERFNRTFEPGNYTAERLSDLGKQLFAKARHADALLALGFPVEVHRHFESLSELALMETRLRLLASIDDMARKGFFERYGHAKAIEAEVTLPAIAIPGLIGCLIQGTADALVQFEDDRWEILDYKTYSANKFNTGLDRCQSNFEKYALAALPQDEALTPAQRFADKCKPDYPADYQLPLYFLAFNEDPRFHGKISGAAIEMIRPQFPDKPEQGSIRLALSAEKITDAAPQLLADLQQYVVNPLRSSLTFATNPASCQYCSYVAVCQEELAALDTEDATEAGEREGVPA
jgi:superfamily I DNA/RNA helicase/CRISPR/Cas system-associated exonuclease Cas4 (RecB family)